MRFSRHRTTPALPPTAPEHALAIAAYADPRALVGGATRRAARSTIAGLQSPAVTLAAAASVAWAEVNAAYTSGAWYGVSPLAVQLFVVHLVFVDRDEARSARLEYESFDEFETARMERFDAVYSWVSANLPVVPDSVATLGLTLMALQYTHTGEGGEWPADRWVPYVRSMLGTYAAVQWWDRS